MASAYILSFPDIEVNLDRAMVARLLQKPEADPNSPRHFLTLHRVG